MVRKEACRQFNELFNLPESEKIDVRVRSDLTNVIKTYDSIASDYIVEEGENDE